MNFGSLLKIKDHAFAIACCTANPGAVYSEEYLQERRDFWRTEIEINGIVLPKFFKIKKGEVNRVFVGDVLTIKNGAIVNYEEPGTHVIIKCFGNPIGTEIWAVLQDLSTEALQTFVFISHRENKRIKISP